MTRHASRRAAMQMIYSRMLGGENADELIGESNQAVEGDEDTAELAENEERLYLNALLEGTLQEEERFNGLISQLSPTRALDRIPLVNRAVLLIAFYELSAMPQIPPNVVINEAVNMAKRFGESSDAQFVNGVLATALKQALV